MFSPLDGPLELKPGPLELKPGPLELKPGPLELKLRPSGTQSTDHGGSGTESLFHGGTLERETAQVREGPFGHEVWENEKGNLEYTIFWPTDEPWVEWVKLELQ